jgi:hypothetical protein
MCVFQDSYNACASAVYLCDVPYSKILLPHTVQGRTCRRVVEENHRRTCLQRDKDRLCRLQLLQRHCGLCTCQRERRCGLDPTVPVAVCARCYCVRSALCTCDAAEEAATRAGVVDT